MGERRVGGESFVLFELGVGVGDGEVIEKVFYVGV